MSKIMPLDELSSIKNAKESQAVKDLFNVIKEYPEDVKKFSKEIESIALENLRDDEVFEVSKEVKKNIKSNFPAEKNGYLVVSKVI